MDRTEWFQAVLSFLVACLTLDVTSDATSPLFADVASGSAVLVILGLPLYLVVHVVRSRLLSHSD